MNNAQAVGTLVSSGLQVPWSRRWLLGELRRRYLAAGRNQRELARQLGVHYTTVNRWLREDPELRAELERETA